LGLAAERWVDAQLGRWPLAAVSRSAAASDTLVHFFGEANRRLEAGGLVFVEHRSVLSGPRWREWGDDWSGSLGRAVRRLKADDLCVLHMDTYHAAVRVHELARNCPTVVVLHGRGFAGAHIRQADAVIALREEVGIQLRSEGFPADRLIVTPPSIDRGLFHRGAARPAGPPFRFGFVGTVSPSKGTGQVIETLRLLKEQGVPFSLDVLGTGQPQAVEEFRGQVADLGVDDCVTTRGHLPAREVAALMAGWHLLLHPSYAEGMPIAVLEALSSGLPVAVVGGVLPPEMERQAGMLVSDRPEFARHVVGHLDQLAGITCGEELLVDHGEGARVWTDLKGLTRRGTAGPRTDRIARCWRLRPIRDAVNGHERLRACVRTFRRALGPIGGLP
jgi:glycosyltransferase involved in cell wall biosynthesis